MNRIRLNGRPRIQRAVGFGALMPLYELRPRQRVNVVFEDVERLPEHPVIFAMNHTDRFNYFPFQYRLWRTHGRFTATWVKGKYYETPTVGAFMEATNNLPTVSRGYIIAKDYSATLGRRPSAEEYALLRRRVDASALGEAPSAQDLAALGEIPRALLTTPRQMLGRRFDPLAETWADAINAVFATMMRRFVALHEEAFAEGLDVIIFPEGTRSLRLSRGRIGLAQVALKYRKTIVPIGCNGSERVYPGDSPIPRGGTVTYRFGEPIGYEDLAPHHVDAPFTPFDARDEAAHRDRFQGAVDVVMERIAGLLDDRYLEDADGSSDGVQGMDRFL